MGFEDVSNEPHRRSEVWKSFLLDRENNQAKCKKCLEERGYNKIFNIKNSNTKSLLDHLKRSHSENNANSIQAKTNIFEKKESIGEVVSKLAIDGITFRIICESAVLQRAFSVSSFLSYYYHFKIRNI